MLLATPQRTALIRLLAPTPMMQALMQWVVDTGTPRRLAARIVTAPAVSAAKPWIGVIRMIFEPIVLMIRFPPAIVPSAIATAQERITQSGTMSVDVFGTYAIRGEATDDSGRKAFADATIDALPAKSKEAVVQLVWTNFDAADEADTFPRLRLQASDPQAKPARVCWADQPIPGFCEVRTKSAYSYMTLRASEKKVPLAVAYLDERIQDGPLACVQVYFDGERTVETCDRQHRDAEERWEVGVLDMTTGKLVDPKAADAGAPAAAAPDEPAAPKKKPL
jgi:hypothetical protein